MNANKDKNECVKKLDTEAGPSTLVVFAHQPE
jgi:hypothetical protein